MLPAKVPALIFTQFGVGPVEVPIALNKKLRILGSSISMASVARFPEDFVALKSSIVLKNAHLHKIKPCE